MSHEHRIADAEAQLRIRLTDAGLEDAHTLAHNYVTDLLRAGWRPTAPAAATPARGTSSTRTAEHVAAARAALAAARRQDTQP